MILLKTMYEDIIQAKKDSKKLLAVLIDPDKIDTSRIPEFFQKVHESIITHVFVGGSTDEGNQLETVVKTIKQHTNLPVLIFPGSHEQITETADGILFLSLLSGRNPKYLIEQQIQSVSKLVNSSLEIIPTGYILIDGGVETAVQRVSETQPISQEDETAILHTALAGQFSGKKLIYLEAGSGAKKMVKPEIIQKVASQLQIPLIVGGGIRSKTQLNAAFSAGADLVVIGTAFEENEAFLEELKK
ncbi:geranylgeranylglyceryl/heptaprenylglyceryl phosphate synthase [Kordia sp. YSTF-M3]|uniref:Geranylgeranylglyceryl phosphate synthase n=1 Tax=Kordia aestuariivivens TaxID=2759037 RepID=A0ABR7QAH0_9FLAO|nr:geranylgeranylglyceryl/heptaprenylglyceryl phosphate synthase [Kordia aestuariivivens]MBC8755560.1 geranylgeranylglyceryl/heptaprenylglyceryl phosphate synthase [Kordia aestuariivivens]